jgi:hypothetical protein
MPDPKCAAAENTAGSRNSKDLKLANFRAVDPLHSVSRKTRAFEGLPGGMLLGGLLDAVDGLKLTQTRSRKIEVALAV